MVFQKKVCHGRSLNTGGGGLPNPTESTTWGPCSLEGGAGQYAPDPRRFQLVRLEGERLKRLVISKPKVW